MLSTVVRSCTPNSTSMVLATRSMCAIPFAHVNIRKLGNPYIRFPKATTKEEAVEHIQSGDNIFIHGGAATPSVLVQALCDRAKEDKLKDIKLNHIHLEGPAPFYDPSFEGIFRGNSMFIGSNARKAVNEGRADFTPIFLSEIPLLYRLKKIPLDVALIHVTPPDKHGYCSLGVTVCEARAAIEQAKVVIAQVNPKMPRTFGDAFVHISDINSFIEVW